MSRMPLAWVLSFATNWERACPALPLAPIHLPVLRLRQLRSSFPFSVSFFSFQYKGIYESYLTDSIKLTPEDKPTKRCC